MVQTPHDIRWCKLAENLKQRQQRLEGTTIKQWYHANGISKKSYYYWQRSRCLFPPSYKIPGLSDLQNYNLCVMSILPDHLQRITFPIVQPTVIFRNDRLTATVTNDISDPLLLRVIREAPHA